MFVSSSAVTHNTITIISIVYEVFKGKRTRQIQCKCLLKRCDNKNQAYSLSEVYFKMKSGKDLVL